MQPLKDVRVLSVTVYLAGPFLSMTMARFGAEVIKIETPGRGDPIRLNGPFAGPKGVHPTRQTEDDLTTKFLKRSEGVKSVTLNLKDPAGRQMFLDMAKESDVVLENLAPGSMKRLGLGYEDVAAVNPRIVYCSISGYGQEGPYADNPAHDHQIQAMSGMMDVNGDPDGPPTRVGVFVGDLATPLYSAFSILAALRHRDQTGEGQYLDASMMDTLATLMFMEPMEEILAQGLPVRAGNNARTDPTGLYRLKDGDIIITLASDERWKRLCGALDADDIFNDPRYATSVDRAACIADVRAAIQAKFSHLTVAEAVEKLENADVPVAPRPHPRSSRRRPPLPRTRYIETDAPSRTRDTRRRRHRSRLSSEIFIGPFAAAPRRCFPRLRQRGRLWTPARSRPCGDCNIAGERGTI